MKKGREKTKFKRGDKYGRLTIIGEVEPYMPPCGKTQRKVLVKCSCGIMCTTVLTRLRQGRTKSCGCWRYDAVKLKAPVGKRYGRLTVIKETEFHTTPSGTKKRRVLCKCVCGTQKTLTLKDVKCGYVKSCGCYNKEKITSHGMYKHPLYTVWESVKQRTLNPKNGGYIDYGGRGIGICNRWLKFEYFMADMLPSYKKGLKLDRCDNDGDYEPSNCRWVTHKENCRNTRANRKYKGLCLVEWAEKLNVSISSLYSRIRRNHNDIGKALESYKTTPYKPMKPYKPRKPKGDL